MSIAALASTASGHDRTYARPACPAAVARLPFPAEACWCCSKTQSTQLMLVLSMLIGTVH